MAAIRSRPPIPKPGISILIASLVFLAGSPARAVWSNDPAVNLGIADGPGEQVVPKVAGGPDGSCYVGWYDNASGNYDIRLQRLSPAGIEQWPHNGMVVSSHMQDTWVTDWDLICDSQGNCVLTFSDIRSGNLDVQAYRIAADGRMLWGPDGINLSQNPAFEPTPAVCEASDGDFVFAWGKDPDTPGGTIQMQRVAPDGSLHFPIGGLAVVAVGTEEPGFPDLEPSLAGDVLLMWVRDTATYMSPRHIRIQRFTPAGSPVWAAFTAIFDASSVPMGYAPEIRSGRGRRSGVWLAPRVRESLRQLRAKGQREWRGGIRPQRRRRFHGRDKEPPRSGDRLQCDDRRVPRFLERAQS